MIFRKWHTVAEVAAMLGYGLTKTKMLIITGELRSLKDGRSRRVLPEWVDEYVARRAAESQGLESDGHAHRANGEGSIYRLPQRLRRLRLGDDTRRTPAAQVRLRARPARSSMPSGSTFIGRQRGARSPPGYPTLEAYLTYWLTEVVQPEPRAARRASSYEMFARLYISPGLGDRRLDKLTVRDVQTWLGRLRDRCQCCAQGKDLARDAATLLRRRSLLPPGRVAADRARRLGNPADRARQRRP